MNEGNFYRVAIVLDGMLTGVAATMNIPAALVLAVLLIFAAWK